MDERPSIQRVDSFAFCHVFIKRKINSGRPAWYDASGEIKEAFVIGICGGSASGKTTVAQNIVEKLNVPWVTLLSMDSFYKVNICCIKYVDDMSVFQGVD